MPGEHILIADDEPDVLDVATLSLEVAGFKVTQALNGREAVRQAQEQPFSLFLTDVKMPVMDGIEAFRHIRQIDPHMVGIVMTGYGTLTVAVQAIKQGFADFLLKPFTPDDLTDAVNRALEKERLRRENLRLRALIPLFELSRLLMSETHLPALLTQVVETSLAETRATSSALFMVGSGGLTQVAAQAGAAMPPEQWASVVAEAQHAGQPLVLDARSAAHPILAHDVQANGSLLALPLRVKEQSLGVLVLHKAAGLAPFAEGDAEMLNILAGQVAVAIENARLFEEREAAFQELQQMDHMKSEFINIAAHELRTPLSLIIGYAGMLEEESQGVAREYAQSISHNADRLRAIVDDMTNLRHLELDEVQLDLTPIDFRQLIQRVVEVVDPPFASQQVRVALELPESRCEVAVDVRKMELVLGNLLGNAYKYSPPDGTITVRLVNRGQTVQCSIQDEGPGIDPTEQEKIWSRFYQVEDSLTRVHGGMGLGLAIVKGMVELHGGRCWVESVPGSGSIFHFLIPKKEEWAASF